MINIKNAEQIEGIRQSCKLAAKTLDFLKNHVQPGVSTFSLDHLADTFIRDHGAIPAPLNYHGFPKSICTSLNEVICHGIPNENEILKEGDILNIDVTTILNGYYGDTSRMFYIRPLKAEHVQLLATAQDCLNIGINQCKPGNPFYKISKAITQLAILQGCSVVHEFCGHGVGLQFHEEPEICHYYEVGNLEMREMQPGMIFTIEPMINLGLPDAVVDQNDKWTARTKDGKYSAQYEHTILITERGAEVLTELAL